MIDGTGGGACRGANGYTNEYAPPPIPISNCVLDSFSSAIPVTMPEYHEVQLMVKYFDHVFKLFCEDTKRSPDWKPKLERVWYHPLIKECKAKGATKRRKSGYLEELPMNSTVMRGMNLGKGKKGSTKTRHHLAPRQCLPDGVSYRDLTLEGIKATSRSLVLNLGQATFPLPVVHGMQPMGKVAL